MGFNCFNNRYFCVIADYNNISINGYNISAYSVSSAEESFKYNLILISPRKR